MPKIIRDYNPSYCFGECPILYVTDHLRGIVISLSVTECPYLGMVTLPPPPIFAIHEIFLRVDCRDFGASHRKGWIIWDIFHGTAQTYFVPVRWLINYHPLWRIAPYPCVDVNIANGGQGVAPVGTQLPFLNPVVTWLASVALTFPSHGQVTVAKSEKVACRTHGPALFWDECSLHSRHAWYFRNKNGEVSELTDFIYFSANCFRSRCQ